MYSHTCRSLGMTLINKHIFSVFSLPLCVTAFQLVVSLLLLWAVGVAGTRMPSLSFAPPPEFDLKVLKKFL
jgi:hypothetical protein